MSTRRTAHTAGDTTGNELAIALSCFDQLRAARKALGALDARLRSDGDRVLDTVILEVNAKHTASVHDPRRAAAGALTAALTWGVFGLVTGGGARGLVIWALIGAVSGGMFAYLHEHVLTKPVLARIGTRLPPSSSALLTFTYSSNPGRLLEASTDPAPVLTTAVTVDGDLTAHTVQGPGRTEPSLPDASIAAGADQATLLTMIVIRYGEPGTAAQIASQAALAKAGQDELPQIELLTRTGPDGRLRVADPSHGIKAMAHSDLISWGGLGLVFGAIAGAVAGGGILGFLGGAVVTGVAWGAFGLAAGALYGMWAGRAISARRLTAVRQLVGPAGSSLLAWAEGPLSQHALGLLSPTGSQSLVLRFDSADRGARLTPATTDP